MVPATLELLHAARRDAPAGGLPGRPARNGGGLPPGLLTGCCRRILAAWRMDARGGGIRCAARRFLRVAAAPRPSPEPRRHRWHADRLHLLQAEGEIKSETGHKSGTVS